MRPVAGMAMTAMFPGHTTIDHNEAQTRKVVSLVAGKLLGKSTTSWCCNQGIKKVRFHWVLPWEVYWAGT